MTTTAPTFDLSHEQQHAVDHLLRRVGKTQVQTMGGYAGCLSGDTTLMYSRGARAGVRPITLRDLFLKFNGETVPGVRGISNRWVDLTLPTRLYSLWGDGSVALNRVVAVLQSGVKPVISVTFDKGRTLVCTPDHPIAVPGSKFEKAAELTIGSVVMARSMWRNEAGKGGIVNTKYHPTGSAKTVICNGIVYDYMRVARARLVVEATMNGIDYKHFVRALKTDPVESVKFHYLPSDVDVHHKDENTLNDDIGNLEVLPEAEHARLHSIEKNHVLDLAEEAMVVGIESGGEEMTYDIQMASPANNFSANGVFVHNTGKTHCVRHLYEYLSGFAICAYTGKASDILRRKGLPAETIHSTIYRPVIDDHGRVAFELKTRQEVGCAGFIVDEGSMVGKSLFADLCSFDLPVIVVGDHGQLPPVGEDAGLMLNPDVRLEEIHRNAGPIARFAEHVRKGREAAAWKDTGSGVWLFDRGRQVPDGTLLNADQIICAFNATRVGLNRTMRRLIGKPESPSPGDRIMCLRNDRQSGVFNGQQGTIRKIWPRQEMLEFDPSFGTATVVFYHPEAWHAAKAPRYDRHGKFANRIPFDFAYCVTAHKFQGDEADKVIVFEEKCDLWEHARWAYTAASRAKRMLLWVQA